MSVSAIEMARRSRSVDVRWYEALRERWKPDRVRLLLVGESAPDAGGSERRFFYAETLTRDDNLFRGVIAALYEPIPRGSTGLSKRPWLERLRADGVFLVDLVPFPVDKLAAAERRRARRYHVPALVAEARRLEPGGVIVCHSPTFKDVAPALGAAGLPVLHRGALPFPLRNTREQFVIGVRAALAVREST